MTIDDGVDLSVRAISAAINRDSASGGMIDVAVITKDGFRYISEEDIKKRMEKHAK